ncbi:MAG: aldo/keto reductase [Methylobacter sp.]|jgi:hypothetical protein
MKLALGTVQFGLPYGIANQAGQISLHEGKAMLQLAADNGIDTLDTAIVYGESEQRLGEIGIQGWQIISKLPAIPDDCTDILHWVAEAVDGSLQRLNVNSLYGLLLHRPQQLMEKNGDELYHALQQLKQDGLVQKIGVSIYDPSELDAICGRFQLDLVQAPFNPIDRRLIDTGWLSRLAEQGTELHVRSIFLQGLLLMSPSNRPEKFDRWAPLWSKWHEWLKDANLAPLQACLRYALSFPEISRVIIGVDNQNQLIEIIHAAEGSALHVPEEFKTDDLDLINPACWAALA